MPGLPPTVDREPLHTRAIEIRGWKRADGLYDIEGHLVDTKPYDFKLAAGIRPAGEPVHDMWLRITVDRQLTIVDAAAAMDRVPYAGDCDAVAPDYRKLVGLAIRPGYLQRVKELFGGVKGCTHVTELAGHRLEGGGRERVQAPDQRPFQLDRCHALDATGPTVARYSPRWYKGTEPIEPAGEPDQH
jgi:hypothetical protein